MIVLDTHAWIWWLSNPERLSDAARHAIDDAMEGNNIYVSSISVWEVALLVSRGRLQFTMDTTEWVARSEALDFLSFVPVNNRVAVKSVQLPEPLHQDPADRIIVATALSLGAKLITRDERLLSYSHVQTLW